MEHESEFQAGDNASKSSDEDNSDLESLKSDEENEDRVNLLLPVDFAGLQLPTTKESMTLDLFRKIKKLTGYNILVWKIFVKLFFFECTARYRSGCCCSILL